MSDEREYGKREIVHDPDDVSEGSACACCPLHDSLNTECYVAGRDVSASVRRGLPAPGWCPLRAGMVVVAASAEALFADARSFYEDNVPVETRGDDK